MKTTITIIQVGTLTETNGTLMTYGKTKDGMIALIAKGQNAQTILNSPGAKLVCQGKATFAQGDISLAVEQVEVMTAPKISSVPMIEINEDLEEANQQIKILEAELERCFQAMSETNPNEDTAKIDKVRQLLENYNSKLTKVSIIGIVEEVKEVVTGYRLIQSSPNL
jgi:hypothetical protein